jgi:hypothetical protein
LRNIVIPTGSLERRVNQLGAGDGFVEIGLWHRQPSLKTTTLPAGSGISPGDPPGLFFYTLNFDTSETSLPEAFVTSLG